MVAYLQQKCIFMFNAFKFNEKKLTFNKIYLYSIKYICIQWKTFSLYTFIFMLIKNHTRTLFQIMGYEKSHSGYSLSFTNVQLNLKIRNLACKLDQFPGYDHEICVS